MKKKYDRRTAAERYTQLPPLSPENDLTPAELHRLGFSQVMKLGIGSLVADRPLVTMRELGDHFLELNSGLNYRSKVEALVDELGPSTIVERLSYPQLRGWYDRQPRTTTTRNHQVDFLAMMIKDGLRDGILWFNPLTGVKELLVAKVELPEAGILSVDQAATIMNLAASERQDAADVLALMLFGGLEVGEAVGLYHEDVTSVIHVSANLTSNCHPWTLYRPPNLRAWLDTDGGRVGPVTRHDGNYMGKVIRQIFAQAGIPRPEAIHFTWAAYRRAVVGDIEKVYAGRHLTNCKNSEDRTPTVPLAEGLRYFDIYPLSTRSKSPASNIIPLMPEVPHEHGELPKPRPAAGLLPEPVDCPRKEEHVEVEIEQSSAIYTQIKTNTEIQGPQA